MLSQATARLFFASLLLGFPAHALTRARLARPDEHTNTVLLVSAQSPEVKGEQPKGVSKCSGVLFKDRYVLSNYHCYREQHDLRLVMQGKTAASFGPKDVRMPPSKDNARRFSDDIALFKLDRPLGKGYELNVLASNIVHLINREDALNAKNNDGVIATVVGHGHTKDKDAETPKAMFDRRRVGTIRLVADGSFFVPKEDETSYLNTVFSFPAPTLVEEGDSGGPVFISGPPGQPTRLYALMTEIKFDAESGENIGATHVLIPNHKRWIEDTIAAWEKE